jgi:hypothetical protein
MCMIIGMNYKTQKPANKPPVLPLSTQMCIAAEMATPEIRGLAEMIGTEWQAEALRLEEEVRRLKCVIRKAHNDLNDPATVAMVMGELSSAILFPPKR